MSRVLLKVRIIKLKNKHEILVSSKPFLINLEEMRKLIDIHIYVYIF